MHCNDEAVLRTAQIRPTRQRLTILRLIRDGGHRHLTPDSLYQEALTSGVRLSLATVYNTLHEFAEGGLVKHVAVGDRSWFCTNTADHHHFYDVQTGRVQDIPGAQPRVLDLPPPPAGMEVEGVDVIVRLRKAS
ncbi:MAG TPA: Fur family transcriptional regulator [Magnetospirillum sp.]|nr:Fur family transcriptional regulator [Magnetospirillum sp.]